MPLYLAPALSLPMPHNLVPELPLPIPLKLAILLPLPMIFYHFYLVSFMTLRAVLALLPLPMPLILGPALPLPMPHNLTPALPLPHSAGSRQKSPVSPEHFHTYLQLEDPLGLLRAKFHVSMFLLSQSKHFLLHL